MKKPWTGQVTIKLSAEFTYDIDEDWKADSPSHALMLAEREVSDYVGAAFDDERFDEEWEVLPD